jgi:hypothetical protein
MAAERTIALEHFTQQAKNLVGEAQNLADERGHALVEPIHLLVRAVNRDPGVAELFQRASAEPSEVLREAEAQLARLGKATSELAYLSNALLALLERARKEAGTRLVGIEQLMNALAQEIRGPAATVLQAFALGPGSFRPHMAALAQQAELARLRAENERLLKQQSTSAVSLRVSEKGGVSVYGLGRFPVTLYKEQWAKLLDMADEIRAFLGENAPKLKTKGAEPFRPTNVEQRKAGWASRDERIHGLHQDVEDVGANVELDIQEATADDSVGQPAPKLQCVVGDAKDISGDVTTGERYSVVSPRNGTAEAGIKFVSERDAMAHVARLPAGKTVCLWIRQGAGGWFKAASLVKTKTGKIEVEGGLTGPAGQTTGGSAINIVEDMVAITGENEHRHHYRPGEEKTLCGLDISHTEATSRYCHVTCRECCNERRAAERAKAEREKLSRDPNVYMPRRGQPRGE